MIGDYEVIGHKIAEMVGNIYENEIKVRDAKIKRLQQQKVELIAVIEEVLDSEGGHNVGTLAWFDKVHDILDRVTGDEE